MALSPFGTTEDRAVEITTAPLPSKTYALDLSTEEVGGIIDGIDAVKQFIRKAIATARFRFMIYGADYGSEIDALIGQDVPDALLQAEIPRVITDTLIYDDRIVGVDGFVIERVADGLYVTFTVDSIYGAVNEGVTL
jgi:phage baseplate assembly protein W